MWRTNHKRHWGREMNTFRFVRVCVAALIAAGIVSLASCGSLDQMAKDQAAYNQSQCQKFGLTPGSDSYVRCINEGASAYAASLKTSANAATPAVITFGAPAKNNACSAPASTPKGSCHGCSVSCGTQQASCTPGTEWSGESCVQDAVCKCQ
jgi:hypothetical protein